MSNGERITNLTNSNYHQISLKNTSTQNSNNNSFAGTCTCDNNFIYNPYIKVIRSHYDFYDNLTTLNEDTLIEYATNPHIIQPYFVTTNEQLQAFDFDYFKISGGNTPYYTELSEGIGGNAAITLRYLYNGVTTNIDVSNYLSIDNNKWTIIIPYNDLTSNVIVRNGETFTYSLYYEPFYGSAYSISTGELVYNIADPNKINEDSQRQLQEQQLQATQDLNKSITDSNIDSSVLGDMPQGFEVNDTSGISTIFQRMYNAFCTDEVIDLTLTIPFVNKSFTVSNTLVNNYPSVFTNIMSVFWWGFIGLFVIKDVRGIINKIAEGNIENVGSDVQKEVL